MKDLHDYLTHRLTKNTTVWIDGKPLHYRDMVRIDQETSAIISVDTILAKPMFKHFSVPARVIDTDVLLPPGQALKDLRLDHNRSPAALAVLKSFWLNASESALKSRGGKEITHVEAVVRSRGKNGTTFRVDKRFSANILTHAALKQAEQSRA